MNALNILNTIRDNQNQAYKDRIPVATATNLESVGQAFQEYEVHKNEFLTAFVGKIAFPQVSNRRFKNPLAPLKKGRKPFGTDIEDIYTNPVKAETFSGDAFDGTGKATMLKVTKPDTKTIYYRLNRKDKYPVSISNQQLKTAFRSEGELNKFFESIITAMYSGDEMDEFILMKNVVSDAIKGNMLVSQDIEYDGSETACKEMVKLLKTLSLNYTLPSNAYNGYNKLNAEQINAKTVTPATTWTPFENQVLIIRSDVDAATDVEVLAKAFNMDKTEFIKRKFVVDTFGDDTLCVLCDEALFQVYDDEYCVRSFDNGSNLTTNFWLHHWQTIAAQLWANAYAIKQKVSA